MHHLTGHLAAQGSSLPFTITPLNILLGSVLGTLTTLAGVRAVGASMGQQAHHKAVAIAGVVAVGLLIAGISIAGLTGYVAAHFARAVIKH
jgi:hypothetical protein